MKKKQWLGKMDLVDEEYVTEADPTKKSVSNKKQWIRWGAIAACFVMLITAGGLWLFLPFQTDLPDVSKYQDSEYYEIIQRLNVLTVTKPRYKNNFQKIVSIFSSKKEVDGEINSMASTGSDFIGDYQEVTDNQEQGVIEGDLIKRSDRYAYYLNTQKNTLEIYSIAGESSTQITSYVIENDQSMRLQEFYLSQDCQTVTVLAVHVDRSYRSSVVILSLDVSNPEKVTEQNRVKVSGYGISSRMVDGNLLLLTYLNVRNDINFSDATTFIPTIEDQNGTSCILAENIFLPEVVTNAQYTVAIQLKEENLELIDSTAVLFYSNSLYVSQDRIFLENGYWDEKEIFGIEKDTAMTEIICVTYGNGFSFQGSVSVKGRILNQYSLDEYQGYLRIVTTTDQRSYREQWDGKVESVENTTSASLYCIDLSDWSVAASVENFAPPGESVRSARFEGDYAYVCTAVQLTDPVFFFDLSDLNHITYKDTGTIEGFSSSLVDFENGNLLGIGVGEQNNIMKIEIYKEGEDNVESVCAYLSDGNISTYFSSFYKSYYIDRKNQLVGLGYVQYANLTKQENRDERYLLLQFDGEKLNVLLDVPLQGNYQNKRGFYADGYYYMFGESDFSVYKISA